MSKKIKIFVVIAVFLVIILGAIGTFLFMDPTDPDKNDKENYIGSSGLSIARTMMLGVTHEDMSSFTVDGNTASMSGYISKDTIRQVNKLIASYPDVTTINMVDVGGSIDDVSNLKASLLVRQAGLDTFVGKEGHIASGGTDFFCAGVNRTIEEGALIGVHSWAGDGVDDAAILPKDHKEHKKYIDYYKEMNMSDPEGFYFFTINAAKADSIYYMTMDELFEYGLIE